MMVGKKGGKRMRRVLALVVSAIFVFSGLADCAPMTASLDNLALQSWLTQQMGDEAQAREGFNFFVSLLSQYSPEERQSMIKMWQDNLHKKNPALANLDVINNQTATAGKATINLKTADGKNYLEIVNENNETFYVGEDGTSLKASVTDIFDKTSTSTTSDPNSAVGRSDQGDFSSIINEVLASFRAFKETESSRVQAGLDSYRSDVESAFSLTSQEQAQLEQALAAFQDSGELMDFGMGSALDQHYRLGVAEIMFTDGQLGAVNGVYRDTHEYGVHVGANIDGVWSIGLEGKILADNSFTAKELGSQIQHEVNALGREQSFADHKDVIETVQKPVSGEDFNNQLGQKISDFKDAQVAQSKAAQADAQVADNIRVNRELMNKSDDDVAAQTEAMDAVRQVFGNDQQKMRELETAGGKNVLGVVKRLMQEKFDGLRAGMVEAIRRLSEKATTVDVNTLQAQINGLNDDNTIAFTAEMLFESRQVDGKTVFVPKFAASVIFDVLGRSNARDGAVNIISCGNNLGAIEDALAVAYPQLGSKVNLEAGNETSLAQDKDAAAEIGLKVLYSSDTAIAGNIALDYIKVQNSDRLNGMELLRLALAPRLTDTQRRVLAGLEQGQADLAQVVIANENTYQEMRKDYEEFVNLLLQA